MRAFLVPCIAAVLAAGCEKQQQPAPPPPQAPAGGPARPAELVIDVVRPSASSLDGLRAFVGAIEPLAAVTLDDATLVRELASAVGLTSPDGLDRTAPLHVLVLEHDADQVGVAVLAKVRDPAQLEAGKGTATVETRGGWAVIGPAPLVHAVAPYALGKLASAPPPARLTAIVYLPRLLADHGDVFATFRSQMLAAPGMSGDMGQLMTSYVDGLASIAHDADEVRVTLDASAGQAWLDLALVPHPRSRFASFVAQQRPDDFRLLDDLPSATPQMVVGGRLRLGPYHAGWLAVIEQLYHTPNGAIGPEIERLMNATSGTFAMVAQFGHGGMMMTQVIGLDDRAAAEAALGRIHAAFVHGKTLTIGQMTATYHSVTEAAVHDHVSLFRFETTYDASKAPAATLAMLAQMSPGMVQHTAVAAFDHEMVIGMAPDAAGEAARAIDVGRGNAAGLTLPRASAALVDAARAHKDSAIMIMDVGALFAGLGQGSGAPAPFAMTLGTAGGALHLGVIAPTASIQAMRHR